VIGLSATLLAKMLGTRVVVVDIVEDKLEHERQHGVDATACAAKVDVASAICDITGGGVQVLIVALGMEATTNASVECLAILGRHVPVGMPSGSGQMQVNMRAIYAK
jgi:alcohol dehydrogenase